MSERMRIGEFALLGGIPPKTLRYYDAIGLLRPASVDPLTGYRYYDSRQLRDLAAIRVMKELGASLAQVRRLARSGADAQERREVLLSLRAGAQRNLREARQSLRRLDAALQELALPAGPVPVVVQQRPALAIASIRARARSYAEIEALERTLLASIPAESAGPVRGVLWHRCAGSGGGWLEGEPFVSLKGRPLSGGAYAVGELPAATLACAYSGRDDSSAERAYQSIQRWMKLRDARLRGPKREVYVGGLLEIQFPLG